MYPPLPAGYLIRDRHPADDAALLAVETRASVLFRDQGYPRLADECPGDVASLRATFDGNSVWIAAHERAGPVGYAVAHPLGETMHLWEIAVDPAHGRRGVGAALARTVVVAARARGLAGVSLTTFRDIPFNAPFYRKLGFRVVAPDAAPPDLVEQFRRELPEGVAAADRVMMFHSTE